MWPPCCGAWTSNSRPVEGAQILNTAIAFSSGEVLSLPFTVMREFVVYPINRLDASAPDVA